MKPNNISDGKKHTQSSGLLSFKFNQEMIKIKPGERFGSDGILAAINLYSCGGQK